MNRIATLFSFERSLDAMNERRAALGRAQLQMSTGKRVNAPSDDPLGAAQAERTRSQLARIALERRMIDFARTMLGQADNAMGDAFARGLRPKVLAPGGDGPKQVATWLACAVGERAWELTEHQHGVFSHYLLSGLQGEAARGGAVSLTALSSYVGGQVSEWARRNGKQQTPRLENPDNLELVLSKPRVGGAAVREIPLATLVVDSDPAGATVQIDGEAKGETPLQLSLPLADGRAKQVQVMLQLKGYQPALAAIDLEPGQRQTWKKSLTKAELPPVTGDKEPTAKPSALPQPPRVTEMKPDQTAGQVEVTRERWLDGWTPGPDGLPMVEVPSGSFKMGSPKGTGDATEGPEHEVSLNSYKIHAQEVTNEAYAVFLNALVTNHLVGADDEGNAITTASAQFPQWVADTILLWSSSPNCRIKYQAKAGRFEVTAGRDQHPVTCVTFTGAALYASYYGLTLPTEAQWERAALGSEERWRYPWGARFDAQRCNVGAGGRGDTVPAMSLTSGKSAAGCVHMVGNVWEWTTDFYAPDYHKKATGHEPRMANFSGDEPLVTLRGGGFGWPADMCSNRARRGANPWLNEPDIGFRCVQPEGTGVTVTQPEAQFTTLKHPITGAVLAVPEGYQGHLMPPNQVVAILPEGDDQPTVAMFYFPVGPVYQNSAQVQNVLFLELGQIGLAAGNPQQDGMIDTGNPQLLLHRRIYTGTFNGDPVQVVCDVVQHHGKYHGLVMGCAPDEWQERLPEYLVFLTRTDFP